MAIPYAPRDYYRPQGADRLIDLIMQRGQIAAQGAQNSGKIWGGAVNSLGGIAADYLGERSRDKAIKAQEDISRRQDEAFQSLLSGDGLPDPKAVLSIYGPERGMKIVSGLASFSQMSQSQGPEAIKHLPDMINGFAALSFDMQKKVYPALKQTSVRSGLFPPDALPDELTPELSSEIIKFGKGFAPGKEEAGFNLSPGQVRFGADGKQIAMVPMPPKEPTGSAEVQLAESYVAAGMPRDQALIKARRVLSDAGRAPEKPVVAPQPEGPSMLGDSPFVNQAGYSKLNTGQKKQADSLNNLMRELESYKKLVEENVGDEGVKLTGVGASALKAKQAKLIFAAAQAEGTGALQRADREVVEQMIGNPTTPRGALSSFITGGKKGIITRLDSLLDSYSQNIKNLGLTRTPPVGGKVATQDDVRNFAKTNGISYEEALAQAKAKGYTVK